ncbi:MULTISPECIES: tyrosine-type recombinase/integrase [unclassified Mesorhizobium]|uniref:tyrosine-type recombinase/integrase n=1 Tax=unclassified Mesorhizobium TaxID=325217 RepID=UPI0015E2D895|nr:MULTISPECIES: tyrosine-type recombinase/integrase [unclassified Mesorhizobium]
MRLATGERLPAVYDSAGILARHPNLYGVLALRSKEGSGGTIEADLRAIVIALNWAGARGIDLEQRTSSLAMLNVLEIEDLRDSLRENLRKRKKKDGQAAAPAIVQSNTYRTRCRMVTEYLAWHGMAAIQRIDVDNPKLPEARHRLELFEKAMLSGLPIAKTGGEREGIGVEAQKLFLDAITPGHSLNPFQAGHQHRNHALLLLYYETSARRGEGLKLLGEDLMLEGPAPSVWIVRRPDDPKDTRGCEPRVKTLGRIVPISLELARVLKLWITGHRSDPARYPGAKRHGYVFVSRTGDPLGIRTENGMFDLLRKRVPGLPPELTTHVLRHTGNDRFSAAASKLGMTEAQEEQSRNYHMGWVKHSKQGARYTVRHTRKRAAEVIDAVQRDSVGRAQQ